MTTIEIDQVGQVDEEEETEQKAYEAWAQSFFSNRENWWHPATVEPVLAA